MDIATLGIVVDSSDATTADAQLKKLASTGAQTEAAMGSLGAASKKANADMRSIANSARQTQQALRQVPMQFTDIAVGLASGQSPLMVLLQQGGQLKDLFGGIGPAARALGGYVAGLVNPFTIAAAAVGVLAVAYKQGSDEQADFAKGIATTGNAAGVTTGQLADMATAIDSQIGTTRQAAQALTLLVSTGRIYGDSLQQLAQSAVAWERATGTAVEDTVKQFAELAKSPVEASAKLNETYHYLTLSVYEQIKALKDQGREQEAAKLAEKTYADALEERSRDIRKSLGLIESAWKSVKSGAAEAWDAILGIGRENTLDEQIKKLTALRGRAAPWKQQQIDADLERLNLQKTIAEGNAAMWAEERRVQSEGIAAENKIASIRDASLSNAERREKALAELRANLESVRVANPDSPMLTPDNVARMEANIRERYKDKDPGLTLDNIGEKTSEAVDQLLSKSTTVSDVFREAERSNEAFFAKMEQSIEQARTNLAGVSDFLLTDEERLQQSYERRQAMIDQAHEFGLVSEERYLQLRNELTQRYDDDAAVLQAQKTSMTLQNSEQLFDGLAGLAKTFAGEQSGLYKAMFAVSKGFAIADAIVKIQAGIANAAALPFPANLGAMSTVAAATGSIVSTISSTRIRGVAHSGMDNIPREGTWLLDGGERVIAPQQNRDLTSFLKSGGKGAAPIVNLYEDKSRAGQVSSRQQDGADILDIFVADIMGDGKTQQAIGRKFGLNGVGR